MKILFIVPYYKPAYIYGGPIVVIALLAENLATLGHEVTVYTSTANGKEELPVEPNVPVWVDGVKVLYFDRKTKNNTFISTQLWKHLSATVTDFDVVHIHTWWNFLVLGAALICKKHNIKPIVSPHGMLSNYILYQRNPFAKKWVHKLAGKKLLQNSWLHVSTPMEWDESRKVIPLWEGKVIPNMITLSDKTYTRQSNDVFSIGFLSRIDPKKGLDVLIRALALVDKPYKLFVAGSGEEDYVDSLKRLSEESGIADKIVWAGWKSGEEKFEFLSKMDLFALTSHSENFAIVVIESLSVGTPVLVSNNVGLCNYVQNTGYGAVVDMDINNIAKAIRDLMIDKEKTSIINTEAPVVIKQEYEEVSLANQYLNFYSSITV